MRKKNVFYFLFAATIVLVRLGVFIFPGTKLRIFGMVVHHFWTGCFLILISLLFLKYKKIHNLIFPVGAALASDELVYILLGGGPVMNYWSVYSVGGMIIVSAIVILLKKFSKI